jgi:predicted PurR-regulated permease PerM
VTPPPVIEVPRRDEIYLFALRVLFWVLCIGVLAFAARQVWPFLIRLLAVLAPFIFGLTVAYLFHPIVVWVQVRLGLGRVAGILTVFALVAAIFLAFFAVLLPILYQQSLAVFDAVQRYVASDRLDALLLRFLPEDRSLDDLKAALSARFDDIRENLGAYLASGAGMLSPIATGSAEAARGAIGALVAFFAWIGGLAGIVILGLVVAFYILADMSRVPGILRRMLPEHGRERIWSVLIRSNEAVGGFLRGQLIACAGVGLLTALLLFVLGLKQYAILIGFIAGVMNFIPYLGPVMGAIPAVLWALFTGDLSGGGERLVHTALILGAFGFVQAMDGFVFQPYIVGRSAALHPLAVMLALVLGAQFGISGMILAVPAACIAKVLFIEFYWKDRHDFLEAER